MKRIALFFYILTMTLACHKVANKTPAEDHTAKATTYIDQGDYTSAIELLEDTLKHEDTYEVRLVLASAYAGRAGVKVENYWDYLIGFDAFAKDKGPEMFPDLVPADALPEALDDKSKDQLKMLNENFKDLQRLEKKASKVPLVAETDRPDLVRARELLERTSTPSSKLYRSLLTVVLVKSEIQDGKALVTTWSDKKFDPCFPIAKGFSAWLSKVLDLVSDGLNDLGKAYPDDDVNYQTMRADVDKGNAHTRQILSYQKTADSLCTNKK